eukprot:SAG11_NODE_5296_length_1603_cov_16.845745_1_plen_365_part_01
MAKQEQLLQAKLAQLAELERAAGNEERAGELLLASKAQGGLTPSKAKIDSGSGSPIGRPVRFGAAEETEAARKIQARQRGNIARRKGAGRVVGVAGFDESRSPGMTSHAPSDRAVAEAEPVSVGADATAVEICSRLFDELDTDSSGSLDALEAKIFLKCSGCPDAEVEHMYADMLRGSDTDHDGLISKEEFLDYTLATEVLDPRGCFIDKAHEASLCEEIQLLCSHGVEAAQRRLPPTVASSNGLTMEAEPVSVGADATAVEICSRLFDELDTDGSGSLDALEAKIFLKCSGCPDAEVEHMYADMLRGSDTDHDGLISKEEFLDYTLATEVLDPRGCFIDKAHEASLCEEIRLLCSHGVEAAQRR